MMPGYIKTPLLLSHPLSNLLNKDVYLKMEALQPSGSFKDRGIGGLCRHFAKQKSHGFVSSSGGNAGIAVAFAGNALNIKAHVVLPKTTPQMIVDKLIAENAEVIVFGENWNEADQNARELATENNLDYIPPFDNPIIWDGYTSLIKELEQDNIKPDAIILSVGGGGLFCGLMQGLDQIGWNDVNIVTAETQGAASFAKSIQQNEHIILDKIDTIATTLGAKQVAKRAFELGQNKKVIPEIVTDEDTVKACWQFATDHRLLVEPACGAALSLLYNSVESLHKFSKIVLIVCGGNGVSIPLLLEWREMFKLQDSISLD